MAGSGRRGEGAREALNPSTPTLCEKPVPAGTFEAFG